MSKAFDTSKNITHTSYPWSRALDQSSMTLIRADIVDRLAMKPHCLVEIGEFSFRNSIIMVFTWRSISLLTIGSTEIGRYPDGTLRFEPLGIAVILPSFQSEGNIPVESERLNSLCKESAILEDVNFSIWDDMPSWPVDFVVSNSDNNSSTDSSVHRKSLGTPAGGRRLSAKSGSCCSGGCSWLKQV